jgi:hypothetical protein
VTDALLQTIMDVVRFNAYSDLHDDLAAAAAAGCDPVSLIGLYPGVCTRAGQRGAARGGRGGGGEGEVAGGCAMGGRSWEAHSCVSGRRQLAGGCGSLCCIVVATVHVTMPQGMQAASQSLMLYSI